MEFVEVMIGPNFPVTLLCFADGTVALHPLGNFPLVAEMRTSGVSSMFHCDSFALKAEDDTQFQEYEYRISYPIKEMPTLKAWLVQQNLESPIPLKEA